jgi:hypothetical protein
MPTMIEAYAILVDNATWLRLLDFVRQRHARLMARFGVPRDTVMVNPILDHYKFTSMFRAADRTTLDVIWLAYHGTGDWLLNLLLFKMFNWRPTWELMLEHLGHEPTMRDRNKLKVLIERARGRIKVFTGAYQTGLSNLPTPIDIVYNAVEDKALRKRIDTATSLGDIIQAFKGVPFFNGKFMGYQAAVDVNYHAQFCFPEADGIVLGPGAIKGIKRLTGLPPSRDGGTMMLKILVARFAAEGITMFGRRLTEVDVEHILCEFHKYETIRQQQAEGAQLGARLYRPDQRPLLLWFPPAWRLNCKVPKDSTRKEW